MKKKLLIIAAGLLMPIGACLAQKPADPVIFEVGGQKIQKSEFMKDFLRSIGKDPTAAPTACTYEKRKALEDYAELFVNFRTKLADAYAMKLDTSHVLQKELASYRAELAVPYLIDSATLSDILHEAYNRNQYALHAAHILIKVPRGATGDDTLKAYQKAMEVYEKAVAGEDFGKLALRFSEDESARDSRDPDNPRKGNMGDLGCFTVFDMVYPFETAAYSLEPGGVSKPVRSQFGYHIVKLYEKTPLFGKTTLQHIWVSIPEDTAYAAYKIKEAYGQLANGTDFSVVARNYSDDRGTAANGGLLMDMAVNRLPSEYVAALGNLKESEFSQPFKSQYGWHIVKAVKKETIPAFDDMVPAYKQRLTRDQRNSRPQSVFVENSKTKYGFVDYTQAFVKTPQPKGKKAPVEKKYMASLDELKTLVTDTVFRGKWKLDETQVTDLRPLFALDGKEYTALDLARFIQDNQKKTFPGEIGPFVEERYQTFITKKVLECADAHLEEESPEFRDLVNEYRSGLMIFSYNDLQIWSKAIIDSVGLQAFYAEEMPKHDFDNEADAPYFWDQRARISTITIADSAYLSPEKARKLVEKSVEKNWSSNMLKSQLASKLSKDCKDDKAVEVALDLIELGHQDVLSTNEWRKGIYERQGKKGYSFVVVEQILNPEPKNLMEARGYYINDYQNYLERQLMEQLRKKYNVVVHQDVIDEITY